jgi:thioesterase domain-containing protein
VQHPVGPYFLGGWSLGGVIAFEMARQLQDQEQQVAMLALIDSEAPSEHAEQSSSATELIAFALHLGFTENQVLATGASIMSLSPDEQIIQILSEARILGLVKPKTTDDELRVVWDAFRNNLKLTELYAGGRYEGRITLFRAQTGLQLRVNGGDPTQSDSGTEWEKLASDGVEILQVPGNHFTMIREPQVKALAQELMSCIRKTLKTTS